MRARTKSGPQGSCGPTGPYGRTADPPVRRVEDPRPGRRPKRLGRVPAGSDLGDPDGDGGLCLFVMVLRISARSGRLERLTDQLPGTTSTTRGLPTTRRAQCGGGKRIDNSRTGIVRGLEAWE